MKIICDGKGTAKKVNPFNFSNVIPMVGMTNFESYHEFEKDNKELPLLRKGKPFIGNGEMDAEIVEAYMKDGVLTYDKDRPYYARNMSYTIIDAYLVTENSITMSTQLFDILIQQAEDRGRKVQKDIDNKQIRILENALKEIARINSEIYDKITL